MLWPEPPLEPPVPVMPEAFPMLWPEPPLEPPVPVTPETKPGSVFPLATSQVLTLLFASFHPKARLSCSAPTPKRRASIQ